MDILEFYASQSAFTDPGKDAQLYENLPKTAQELCETVQGLCLDFNERPNFPIQNERLLETNSRYADEMLDWLVWLDKKSPIEEFRPEDTRLMAAPNHFTSLFVSMARNAGIPARQRVGFIADGEDFANYSIAEVFADGEWKQIDVAGKGGEFISAAQAFADCRAEKVCGSRFVNTDSRGVEVLVANLMLDLAALLKCEMNTWDKYGWMCRPVADYSKRTWEILDKVAETIINDDKNIDALEAAYKSEEGLQIPESVWCDTPLVPPHKVVLR